MQGKAKQLSAALRSWRRERNWGPTVSVRLETGEWKRMKERFNALTFGAYTMMKSLATSVGFPPTNNTCGAPGVPKSIIV